MKEVLFFCFCFCFLDFSQVLFLTTRCCHTSSSTIFLAHSPSFSFLSFLSFLFFLFFLIIIS